MYLYQHLRYKNDENGGPQRLYVFYKAEAGESCATIELVYKEWYDGRPDKYIQKMKAIELPSVDITKEEFDFLMGKIDRKKGEEIRWDLQ